MASCLANPSVVQTAGPTAMVGVCTAKGRLTTTVGSLHRADRDAERVGLV
jgi:hypothetical protein